MVNVGFTVHSETEEAAFLVPGGESRRVETFFDVQRLERYLSYNYAAILARFSDHPNLDTLMILRGTTYSDGYCQGVLRQGCRASSGILTINPLSLDIFSLDVAGNLSSSEDVRLFRHRSNLADCCTVAHQS